MKKKTVFYILIFLLVCIVAIIGIKTVFSLYDRYFLPKIIWSYWNDTNIPPFIQNIMDNRKNILKDWEFRVLNDTTISNYLSYLPPNYHDLKQSHKSDWLRLALLEKYGGCWLDATIIVNSSETFNEIYNKAMTERSEFVGFYTPIALINNDPTTYVESWFMMCPIGSRVIKEWNNEFLNACRIGFAEYRKSAERDYDLGPFVYDPKRPDDVYLTVYAAGQIAIQHRLKKKANLLLFNSYDTMYKLHYECWDKEKSDYDSVCIAKKIREEPEYVKTIPFIKLTRAQYSLLT